MIVRILFLLAAVAVGAALGTFVPGVSRAVRASIATLGWPNLAELRAKEPAPGASAARKTPSQDPGTAASQKDAPGDLVKLSPEQIVAARIEAEPARGGSLDRHLTVPGTIVPSVNRIGRVAVRLNGIVAELRKKLGDPVTTDEIVAVLESREVADAKSEYLAALNTNYLQQTLFERDKVLWEKRITTEQQFLRARTAAEETRIKTELARQKLSALGLSEKEIGALPQEPVSTLRRQAIRSPVAGRVVERRVDIGAPVGRDNLETELFVIVDLAEVWVELAVSPGDLPMVREGQAVTIIARGTAEKTEGKIVFISPLLDKETRSARVVAEIANPSGAWRPGSFVTAEIAIPERPARLLIPKTALQTIGGEPVVFVRTSEGFEKRRIVIGRSDDRDVEVVSGAEPGQEIAVRNTFKLKAELGKAQAED